MTITANLYDVLAERGMLAQSTDENIRQRLQSPQVAYNGFDPTADSLHVGHLLPVMGLAHLQRCGHKPIVVIGGATAMVGDPSGKTEARQMLTREQIEANGQAIGAQIGRLLSFDDSPTGAVMVNNADWLAGKGWIEMLREIGAHFSVNRMLSMESVKGRLESGGGITYLEFSYMIMQAYDFLHLHREHGCTLQFGGQDQWGNIVMGIELGRRLAGAELAGLTLPLVTRADGGKFGKTEAGTVWLDPKRTSPYEFYQFFRNTTDADVGKYLGFFTFLPTDEVRELASREGVELNASKEVLAYEATKLIHGEAEAAKARDDARKAFGEAKDVTGDAIPHAELPASELSEGVGLLALMVRAGLAKSNGEARRLVQGGGVRLHDEKVADAMRTVTAEDVQDGYVLMRVGKKRLFRFDVKG
ncbi:tyrosine--tRNA ligase [Phycisphaerales bacterium AB-hyl4]|uniref:Tyrosine--tRNA ligase n=1 Tax=Natronomicrosphaera hydrolytica TaxID=3242702 RepID=A0ABV4U9Y0_9BACT